MAVKSGRVHEDVLVLSAAAPTTDFADTPTDWIDLANSRTVFVTIGFDPHDTGTVSYEMICERANAVVQDGVLAPGANVAVVQALQTPTASGISDCDDHIVQWTIAEHGTLPFAVCFPVITSGMGQLMRMRFKRTGTEAGEITSVHVSRGAP